MGRRKLPVFWTVVLVFGMIWFAKEMGWLAYNFDFPWIPAILIIFALSAIVKRVM